MSILRYLRSYLIKSAGFLLLLGFISLGIIMVYSSSVGGVSVSAPCAIAGPGAASSYTLTLLFIPALILIRRLWRKRQVTF